MGLVSHCVAETARTDFLPSHGLQHVDTCQRERERERERERDLELGNVLPMYHHRQINVNLDEQLQRHPSQRERFESRQVRAGKCVTNVSPFSN